jgi:hypothetical protein
VSITVTSLVASAHSAHTALNLPCSNAHCGHVSRGRPFGIECCLDTFPNSKVSSTSCFDTNLQSMRHDACSENSIGRLRKRARKLASAASRVSSTKLTRIFDFITESMSVVVTFTYRRPAWRHRCFTSRLCSRAP